MPAAKEIKRRIKSIKNTQKITKAMELVSSAKMRKAVGMALASRPYAQYAVHILNEVSQKNDAQKYPLFAQRPISKVAVVVLSSDRGLCGSFNTQIIKKVLSQVTNERMGKHAESDTPKPFDITYIALGKKGGQALKKTGAQIMALYDGLPDYPTLAESTGIAKQLIASYLSKECDRIVVAYTDYRSPLVQTPKLRQLLPISPHDLEKILADLPTHEGIGDALFTKHDYLFEPSPVEIIEKVVTDLVSAQLYQLQLESKASEHAARMVAMKQAKEAAGEMIDDLTLVYNKERQAGITKEIAEITGAKVALENI